MRLLILLLCLLVMVRTTKLTTFETSKESKPDTYSTIHMDGRIYSGVDLPNDQVTSLFRRAVSEMVLEFGVLIVLGVLIGGVIQVCPPQGDASFVIGFMLMAMLAKMIKTGLTTSRINPTYILSCSFEQGVQGALQKLGLLDGGLTALMVTGSIMMMSSHFPFCDHPNGTIPKQTVASLAALIVLSIMQTMFGITNLCMQCHSTLS